MLSNTAFTMNQAEPFFSSLFLSSQHLQVNIPVLRESSYSTMHQVPTHDEDQFKKKEDISHYGLLGKVGQRNFVFAKVIQQHHSQEMD